MKARSDKRCQEEPWRRAELATALTEELRHNGNHNSSLIMVQLSELSWNASHVWAGSMKLLTGLLAAMLLLAGVGTSHAVVRIANDRGGQIGRYVERYEQLRASGQTVMIDGLCASFRARRPSCGSPGPDSPGIRPASAPDCQRIGSRRETAR